jgi:hypothetical protein
MLKDEKIRDLLARLEYQAKMAQTIELMAADSTLGSNEFALGDFIIRGRFKTIAQMLGEEL